MIAGVLVGAGMERDEPSNPMAVEASGDVPGDAGPMLKGSSPKRLPRLAWLAA